MESTDTPTVSEQIASLRPLMYRLALLQLREPTLAEDVTQEAMVAAVEKQATFEGRSSLQTWVVSILRFKIIDMHRKRRADAPASAELSTLLGELDAASVHAHFDPAGRWAAPKQPWSDPVGEVQSQEFFEVLQACMNKLPRSMARVFLMRQWLELPPAEICSTLELSPGNLRVILYRARMQLRACMEKNWSCP